ncbi:hypothetical protein LMG10661_00789 [Ralstonia syzygii subsp. syzygii]|nr:hypothetical protein LMG10661_00789 [Ralstonia syzygii subsp. syzygii]
MFEVNGRKYRYRTDWRGRLILQVQVQWTHYDTYTGCAPCSKWVDARVGDLPVAG